MSYSTPTYQVTKNNLSNANEYATSPDANTYTKILRTFVYEEIIKTAKKRSKNDVPQFDIDSKDLLKTAISLADAEFTKKRCLI
ncbi:hypothetical protein [Candidatus Nitrosocosmicus sp. SS]|jgi:hypothetical protein|uniref:hypothetical protein n=1 Tax=Candidatus Nitrosocosmicus agrestis TaxID=2563600 RepID=UPI00122E844E|nr:hypothetical protein [Candidatus Nitrosocosmicus sp. SS]KAA2282177.1 hypothetical protein F1Z66_07030 [Candidatus Nitrosocosmicus sp. SS]KAF0869977.1 hypothetical protein E5N71_01780 [Candidatus Nitrosocosmicus sp. SS]